MLSSRISHLALKSRCSLSLPPLPLARRMSSKSNPYLQAQSDRNTKVALYVTSIIMGTLGASYASVPLYKVFCQRTGFGGTTKRVYIDNGVEYEETTLEDGEGADASYLSQILRKIYNYVPELTTGNTHGAPPPRREGNTWKDSGSKTILESLKPPEQGRLLKVTFTSAVSATCPLIFRPSQKSLLLKTDTPTLAFYTVVNPTKKAITAVSTYNVHPPQAGRFFSKIQCFCFEGQRILPGEEVDLPVLFFIGKDFEEEGGLDGVRDVTLSYTFFKNAEDDDDEEDPELEAALEASNARPEDKVNLEATKVIAARG